MRVRIREWKARSKTPSGCGVGVRSLEFQADSELEAAMLSIVSFNAGFDAILLFANLVHGVKSGAMTKKQKQAIQKILDSFEPSTTAEICRRVSVMAGVTNDKR